MTDKVPEIELPVACVNRIIKNVLPDNILMTKEARAAFVRATGIFIFYLTHAANDFTRESKRSTLFPQDVINSLKELGFEDFERPLLEFLDNYRKEAHESKKTATKKSSTKESASGEAVDDSMNVDSDEEGETGNGNQDEDNMEDDLAESEDDAEN